MKRQFIPYHLPAACLKAGRLAAMVTCLLLLVNDSMAQYSANRYAAVKSGGTLNTTASATVSKKASTIGDYVWIDLNNDGLQDATEPGVPNVLVVLYDSLLNSLATRYTDNNGHYSFDSVPVPPDGDKSFMVGFYNIPPDYAYTKLILDSIYVNSSSKLDPITGRTKLFSLHSGASRRDIDGGIKNAPGIVLPLTIDQFNGAYSNGFIQLRWTTFTEINIDHFEVERSTDGTNFRQIGRIEALGNNSGNISYTFSDLMAEKGSNFYRLVMIDNEGNYTYSKAITVSVESKGISVMVVYPNPFSKRVVVKINSEKNSEQITIRIINNDGVVLRTQLADVMRGENNITVKQVDELPGGVYFLEVIAEHRSMKTKLMKQ